MVLPFLVTVPRPDVYGPKEERPEDEDLKSDNAR